MKTPSKNSNYKCIIYDLVMFFIPILTVVLFISHLITWGLKNNSIAKSIKNGIIPNTSHPMTIMIICVVSILLASAYTAYRYLKGNTAVKEINEFSLFFPIIYPAYMFLFHKPISYVMTINNEASITPPPLINTILYMLFLITLFIKALIIIIDFRNSYKTNEKEIENKKTEEEEKKSISRVPLIAVLAITLCYLFSRKK
ncbi:hypothetical protein [Pectobacterium polaris]|uniref:hypothetical protein n=1 Tax=Pectobacterium polaris TaxID=2042057 RepID=UPI0013FE20EC|nr:hypothetical protein [Pectobacterium polaris]